MTNSAKKIEFIEKDQIWADETTNYWFEVDGESYAISDTNGDTRLLDCDGCPVEPCNDHDNIKDAVMPMYKENM